MADIVITDARIGVMKNGQVFQYPSRFINGGFWNRAASSTPTTHYFGKDLNYFCVLPIGVGVVPQDIKNEMLAAIGELEVAETTPAAETNETNPVEELPEELVAESKPDFKKKSK